MELFFIYVLKATAANEAAAAESHVVEAGATGTGGETAAAAEGKKPTMDYELFQEMRRNPLAKNPFFVKNMAARFTGEGTEGLDPGNY